MTSGPVCFTPTPDQMTCPQGCAPLCKSDRSLKRDIEPIDRFAVLDTVSRLPISTWSYKTDPTDVRHMGPMAQDFKAAFGLGDTDRGYYSIDAHGVSLAAIQALYELGQEQSRRIDRLEKENESLAPSGRENQMSPLLSGYAFRLLQWIERGAPDRQGLARLARRLGDRNMAEGTLSAAAFPQLDQAEIAELERCTGGSIAT